MGSSDMRPDAIAPHDAPVATVDVATGSLPAASPSSAKKKLRQKPVSGSKGADHQVGDVLRSVYQTAVQEDIPAEMLDLLNKLD
ncbi:MAG: NepR family anti-sigma factor [Pseudomonadota bacterium]|uniref:NepR family anti-sigma factor n=1 Tax=Sphingobium sp. CECT 9361 TaxID=2845384 RepID=UPI001E556569|nr:NepR family anti-sigma factor [Sphingobium sp. CECT 9361]